MNKNLHVAVHLGQVASRKEAKHIFPLLYMWFKDYYYQQSEYFEQTTWSYIDTHDSINDTEYFSYLIENPPHIFALSLYMWNSEALLRNVKIIKQHFPDCIIVAGGPSAEATVEFMTTHDIDLVILGPGTEIFKRIVDAAVNDTSLNTIAGVAFCIDDKVIINSPPSKKEDPLLINYVNNFRDETIAILDKLTDNKQYPVTFLSILMQGCPYTCSFCEQGSSLWTKVSTRSVNAVLDELLLLSGYPVAIRFIDSNFGITPQYEIIVDYLITLKQQHSQWDVYLFEPDWAKNTTEAIFKMQDRLITNKLSTSAGMIALQDLDQDVLKLNGRPGATDYKKINRLIANMEKSNMRNPRVDLIFGMPGQTRESLINTITELSTLGVLSTPYIYLVFPNTPFGDKLPAGSKVVACFSPANYHALICHDQPLYKLSYLVGTNKLSTKELFVMIYVCRLLFEMQKDFLLDSTLKCVDNYSIASHSQFYRQLITNLGCSDLAEIQLDIKHGTDWLTTGNPTQYCSLTGELLHPLNTPTYRYISSLRLICNIIAKTSVETGVPHAIANGVADWEYYRRNSIDHTSNTLVSYNWDDIIDNTSDTYYQSVYEFQYATKQEIITNVIRGSSFISRNVATTLSSLQNPESTSIAELTQGIML